MKIIYPTASPAKNNSKSITLLIIGIIFFFTAIYTVALVAASPEKKGVAVADSTESKRPHYVASIDPSSASSVLSASTDTQLTNSTTVGAHGSATTRSPAQTVNTQIPQTKNAAPSAASPQSPLIPTIKPIVPQKPVVAPQQNQTPTVQNTPDNGVQLNLLGLNLSLGIKGIL